MAFIIIKDRPGRYGRTRSEQEANLRKDGMSTLTDKQLDQLKYLERKAKDELNVKHSFFDKSVIDKTGDSHG